ncbi:tyrosinase family protein, partial [Streptomyces sp. NPDC048357]|uniref:tyrosinase family protein n=1 Tax=Streptomyces sp. NPDC048357 TaxID=3154719 RepID=UPI003425A0A1
MGIRKNYRSLTSVERNRLVQAIFDLKSKGIVDQYAALHEEHFSHGIHRGSHFLPWHREFILRFETELRKFHPAITLPYWDSSVDQSANDPLWQTAFLGQFNAPWSLGRTLGADILPTPQQIQANQGRATYDVFWPELETAIHNPPHRWVGGKMAMPSSPADPVFYLHHCWIDLLWARWQQSHPNVPFVASRPGQGLNEPLMGYPDRTPAHVLDHRSLGYGYDIFEPAGLLRRLIVWHNGTSNETQIWAMNGYDIVDRRNVRLNGSDFLVGAPWRLAGVGDVTGNGQADIVWHNGTSNETQIWAMNGYDIVDRRNVRLNGSDFLVGAPWRLAGVGDVTGDGQADIVWHNGTSNETQIWAMNGHYIVDRRNVRLNGSDFRVGAPWRLAGVGDVTGNGQADIV